MKIEEFEDKDLKYECGDVVVVETPVWSGKVKIVKILSDYKYFDYKFEYLTPRYAPDGRELYTDKIGEKGIKEKWSGDC